MFVIGPQPLAPSGVLCACVPHAGQLQPVFANPMIMEFPDGCPPLGKTVVCKSLGCGKGGPRSDNLGIGVGHTAAGCNFGVDTYPQPAGHSCSQSTALARPNNNSVESRHTGLVSGAGSPPTRKTSCEVEFGEPARSNRSAVGDEARRYAGVPGPVPV